ITAYLRNMYDTHRPPKDCPLQVPWNPFPTSDSHSGYRRSDSLIQCPLPTNRRARCLTLRLFRKNVNGRDRGQMQMHPIAIAELKESAALVIILWQSLASQGNKEIT